ncbi:MAG: hypothetical protein GY820_17315 [Gammaproteobacteria bacterium]|nr:hypothetical protein [Gammaproteobacteria bacterium]
MTEQEYRDKIKEIDEEAGRKKLEIDKAYAFLNSLVEVGDIVKDHHQIILVDKIFFQRGERWGRSLPCCVYEGLNLTKKFKPFKGEKRDTLWQSNLKKIVREGKVIYEKA